MLLVTCFHGFRTIIKALNIGLDKQISCGACNRPLARKKDIFNVPGSEGVAGAYVNSYGSVHQTLTVKRLQDPTSVELQGRPCTQDSWFPGYAWTIAVCGTCGRHLGWKFTWVGSQRHPQGYSSEDDGSHGEDELLSRESDASTAEVSESDESMDSSSHEEDTVMNETQHSGSDPAPTAQDLSDDDTFPVAESDSEPSVDGRTDAIAAPAIQVFWSVLL